MNIRHATMDDLDRIAAIEAASYPEAESASKASLRGRLEHFANCFWLLENDQGQVIAFINSMLSNRDTLTDEMFDHPEMHDPAGRWLIVFSVTTDPSCRSRGYASLLMKRVIADMQAQGRAGIVLTCKEKLLGFYARFGYVDEGVSGSTHGGATWHQMRLRFDGKFENKM